MSENTKIQWCHHTFNGWEGCTKVSEGCLLCYAETRNIRFTGGANWGRGKPRRRTSPANWRLPIKWNREAATRSCGYCEFEECNGELIKQCKACAVRPRVFCASLADWLDDEVPIEWLADLLKLIHDTPNLDWLLLTKRPENWISRIQAARNWLTRVDADVALWLNDWLPTLATGGVLERGRQSTTSHPAMPGTPPANVWVGASVENQKRAAERIPELLKIPARVRFLSVEPMLGPIDLEMMEGFTPLAADLSRNKPPIDWAIFGGESGPGARPCSIEWISNGVTQCHAAGVAPFVKQLGADVRCDNANCYDWPDDAQLEASGEGFASCRVRLQDKKGGNISQWPEDLRVREFPEVRS